MNTKKLLFWVLPTMVCQGSMQADVRKPAMPRGLSVEKSITAPPKERKEKKLRNLRHKRKGLQGLQERYTFSDLYFEELEPEKNRLIDSKNYFVACKYLKRMIALCDDSSKKADLMIELADLLFLQQSFDDAAKWYADFIQLYPGNKQIEYASYRAVICASKNMLGADRDQVPTEKTLELAQNFLKRSDLFITYKREIEAIEQDCMLRLAEHDLYVAEFYLNKHHDYESAKQRIVALRTDWLDKMPTIGVELAKLELALAEQCADFKLPKGSITLAQVQAPTAKKIDMTARF